MLFRIPKIFYFICLAFLLNACATTSYSQRPQVQQYIQQVAQQNNFDPNKLTQLFNNVKPDKRVLASMTKPSEAMPWYAYRPIFLTQKRIQQGVLFWQQHATTLAYASKEYGVAPEIIVAILGVETVYGRGEGGYSALDSLATLAFDYPPRANYFRGELTQFLLLTREIPIDPLAVRASYAGALGAPQFMPSSYRHYAVAYNLDHYPNLFSNSDDYIVSVARYFQMNGWQAGGSVTVPARVVGQAHDELVQHGYNPKLTLTQLSQLGIYPARYLPNSTRASLVSLQTHSGEQYWLGLHNFYVITRYNSSPLYAMAVYQLSQAVKTNYQRVG